ncbi:MAG: hypothetical protein RL042_841 [Nitrospirota bacterium]|jgi:uncharacterized membrane protein
MGSLISYVHMLAVAVLVGKVVLLSFVVAPILAKTLERESFSTVVRQLFPAYYALGMGAAIVGVVCVTGLGMMHDANPVRHLMAAMWLIILAAETYCRALLTPQSNAMRDRLKEQEAQGTVDPALQVSWSRLHQRSVYLNSMVLLAGLCLLWLAQKL